MDQIPPKKRKRGVMAAIL